MSALLLGWKWKLRFTDSDLGFDFGRWIRMVFGYGREWRFGWSEDFESARALYWKKKTQYNVEDIIMLLQWPTI